MSDHSASNGGDILIEIKNLKKYFSVNRGIFIEKHVGDVKAVDDISFVVKKGETIGLVGEVRAVGRRLPAVSSRGWSRQRWAMSDSRGGTF